MISKIDFLKSIFSSLSGLLFLQSTHSSTLSEQQFLLAQIFPIIVDSSISLIFEGLSLILHIVQISPQMARPSPEGGTVESGNFGILVVGGPDSVGGNEEFFGVAGSVPGGVDGPVGFGEGHFLGGLPSGPLEVVGEFLGGHLGLQNWLGLDVEFLEGFLGEVILVVVPNWGGGVAPIISLIERRDIFADV